MKIFLVVFSLLFVFSTLSAASASSPAEREAEAYKIFHGILAITSANKDVRTVLPKVEGMHIKIIKEYPDTALAQESYWRLISVYIEKVTPPEYDKAEALYNEFVRKYPSSRMRYFIEDTLSRNYHKNGKWDKLLTLCMPEVNEWKKTGQLTNPNPVFMYAKAKFNLGEIPEAENAYKAVYESFPKSEMAAISKKKLEEIKKIKKIPEKPE